MSIDIQAKDFSLTSSILRQVERRIRSALSRRFDRIKHISVRLADVNGPRGGKDKSCRIRVSITGQSDIFIEDIQYDLYAAIYRAAERANRTIARRLARERQRFTRSSNRPEQKGILLQEKSKADISEPEILYEY